MLVGNKLRDSRSVFRAAGLAVAAGDDFVAGKGFTQKLEVIELIGKRFRCFSEELVGNSDGI